MPFNQAVSLNPTDACRPTCWTRNAPQFSFKVKLVGVDMSWSQDVNVDNSQHGQLVRLQTPGRKDIFHVWCRVMEQAHTDCVQTVFIFSPLFVVRTQLPASLLVNIESSVPRASLQLSLGVVRGREEQLELFGGGSVVHHLTSFN